MSRYINADTLKASYIVPTTTTNSLCHLYVSIEDINDAPSIDLADYVPKDFHDKTCEAMAKAHQEEIADMVRVVRCKECKHWIGETEYYEDREYKACWQLCGQYMDSDFWCKYGEREGE